MRVIAGAYKGRPLKSPRWEGLRPTSDRLRETLFNVLAPRIAGARVLDLFAGTGAIGIEALSRGAVHVTFVDRDPRALGLIAENLRHCGIAEGYAIIRANAARSLPTRPTGAPYDLIVLDPPYMAEEDTGAALAVAAGWLADGGLLVLERAARGTAPEVPGLERVRDLRSGDSALSFYVRRSAAGSPDR